MSAPSFDDLCVPRLGVARLTRMAFQGADLASLWNELMDQATDDVAGSGMAMDLSAVAQLRGDKETGLAIQNDTLRLHRLFRSTSGGEGRLRVLALACASDIGANTPLEFLVEGSAIDLAFLYLVPGMPLPDPLPVHDVAIVVAPASADGEAALAMIEKIDWPAALLNPPAAIRDLERDRLHRKLAPIAGLHIPATARVSRDALERGALAFPLPLIIRPLGSHAGFGLARIEEPAALKSYLENRGETAFFISPYIDYASPDGQFRKYRIALIDGKAFAVHMAIADEWKVWYLNADMALSVPNRVEEASFMEFFDQDFALRHKDALAGLAAAIGLDYVLIDCAQTADGKLLVFEADHCAIVHDMDPPSVYPYKPAQMKKLFDAFAAMLLRRAACAG